MISVIKKLLEVGYISYKRDLMVVVSSMMNGSSVESNQKMASRKIKDMIAKGYLEEYSKEKNNLPHDMVGLTSKALTYYGDKNNMTVAQVKEYYPRAKDSYTAKNIKRNMRVVRTMLCLGAAGARVHPHDKPSLENLYLLSTDKSPEPQPALYAQMNKQEIQEALYNEGIYYSDKEAREYLKKYSARGVETTYLTHFDGLYIAADKLLIIFTTRIDHQKQIVVQIQSVNDIIKSLAPLAEISQAYRNIPSLGQSSIYALVLTTGYELIYSSVIGRRYGHGAPGDKYDLCDTFERIKKHHPEKDVSIGYEKNRRRLLANTNQKNQIFKRVFMVPFNQDGVTMLNTLLYTTLESWSDESKIIFNSVNGMILSGDAIYSGVDQTNRNAPAIFMPVPEINELRKMYEIRKEKLAFNRDDLRSPISIVAPEPLHELYAHCIRNEDIKFYSISNYKENEDGSHTVELSENKCVGKYAASGYYLGQELLMLYLKKLGKKYTQIELKKLPALFNKTTSQFYNDIYDKKINFAAILKALPPKDDEEDNTYTARKKSVSFTLPYDYYKKLKSISSITGKSMNVLVRDLVIPWTKKQDTTKKHEIKKQ